MIRNRHGDLPAFIGQGKAMIQMVSWRCGRFEGLPSSMLEYIKAEARLWMAPRKALNEIRELQK